MCSLKNIFFIVLFSLSTSIYSQTKIKFLFQNASLQSQFEELIKINTKVSNDFVENIKFLETYLTEKGFLDYNIVVDTLWVDTIETYLVNVSEGKRYIIKSLKIVGDSIPEQELLRINSNYENAIFNQKNVTDISFYLVDLLEKKGNPFAEAKFLSFNLIEEKEDEKYFELIFKVNKNEDARISKIEIKGNKHTNRDVLIREMRIAEGELFTPELSRKILFRLNRLNIFSNLNNPQFYFDEDKNGILEIEVIEGRTNSFDGIIGYVPSTNPLEKGYVTGQVNVSLRNLFGTLRAFSFRWNRLNRFSQDIEIKYLEPWLFGFPLNVHTTFGQLKQDTTYIQRTFAGNFELSLTEYFGLVLNLTTSSVIPQVNYYVMGINRSSSFSYGLGLIYDSRDHPIYTKSGILFKTDLNQIIKKDYLLSESKKFYQQKVNISFSIHHQFLKNQLIYFSLNTKVINGGGIAISDLFRFGGMNSLRGYEEYQFTGSRIFWSNLEYRFLTSYTDYISAFLDYGYYFRDILNEKISKFKYGYGIGAGFQTALGLLKINFALGEGDTFSRGKIHFGIVSGF